MSRLQTNLYRTCFRAGSLVILALGVSALALGQSQKDSPVVSANVDDMGWMSAKKPSSLSRPGMTTAPEGFEKLTLAPGYLLQMDIYSVPEMSTELRIDAQGNATIPLLGAVHLAGQTLPQAANTIAKKMVDEEILKDPQVILNVVEVASRNVSVLGEVVSPGRIQLLSPRPLGDVLALAGGETGAAGKDIEIQHPSGSGNVTKHIEYAQGGDTSLLQNVMIDPGETIIVHKAGVVYVMGAVKNPGGYLMVNSGKLNVTQAVSLAGGTTIAARTRWAILVRPHATGVEQIKVPLGKMQKGSTAPILLQANDVLYIPTSAWKTAMQNSTGILSAAASASIYRQ